MLPKKPRPKNGVRNKGPMSSGHSSNNGAFDPQDNRSDRPRHNNGPHRGNHQQLFDKYMNLARDSLTAGDRVSAEFHYQHADHYLRLMNERSQDRDLRPDRRPQPRPRFHQGQDQSASEQGDHASSEFQGKPEEAAPHSEDQRERA